MSLYEKFNWKIPIDSYLSSLRRSESVPTRDDLVPSIKSDLASDCSSVTICYYLLGQLSQAREYARLATKYGLDYFFGPWRSSIKTDLGTFDLEWWRTHASWITRFQETLCWASCVEDWTSVTQLAKYPSNRSRPGVDGTREDAAALFVLACFLRGDPATACQSEISMVKLRKKQKPKLIVSIVESLFLGNQQSFANNLEAYLRYFGENEFRRTSLDRLFSFDGTVFVNVGKRVGLSFEPSSAQQDYLIRM